MKSMSQFLAEKDLYDSTTKPNPKKVLDSYLETAFWADFPEDEKKLGVNKLARSSKDKAAKEVTKFLYNGKNATILQKAAEGSNIKDMNKFWKQVGHDLWLTRNGHGAGFWDTPKTYGGDKIAKQLTKMAEALGGVDLYVGDDGKVYIE